MDKALRDINGGRLEKVYLFHGEERFLVRHYTDAVRELAGSGMNTDVFEGEKVSVDEIINAAETLPFLGDSRLVIVNGSKLFASGKKNESEKMAEYIKETPDSTVILFTETDVDKRGKLYKRTAEAGAAVEFTTPSEGELIRWLDKVFGKSGKKISPAAANFLIRYAAGNMEDYIREAEKLISFTDSDEITTADIESVCTKSLEAKIFDLVAAIGNRNAEAALQIYTNLLFAKEAPVVILSMIARQFRLILQCGHLRNAGASPAKIASELGLRDFIVRECTLQSKNFGEQTLLRALDDCLETDVNIKTGQMADRLAAELLIIKYSQK